MILKLVGDIKRGGIQILGVKLKWQLYVLGVLFLKFGTMIIIVEYLAL